MTGTQPAAGTPGATSAGDVPPPVDLAARAAADADRWLDPLRASGRAHEDAVRRLHELLVRAARYEVRRRARQFGLLASSELDDLVTQSADDALVAILARLDAFEGRSAFTTWAWKFAIHGAGVAVRRLAWREREVPSSDDAIARLESDMPGPVAAAEQHDDLRRLVAAIGQLTPRQREVLLALCVSDVPIDVLADRLGATRGAIYKTLHDARVVLRRRLGDATEGGDHG